MDATIRPTFGFVKKCQCSCSACCKVQTWKVCHTAGFILYFSKNPRAHGSWMVQNSSSLGPLPSSLISSGIDHQIRDVERILRSHLRTFTEAVRHAEPSGPGDGFSGIEACHAASGYILQNSHGYFMDIPSIPMICSVPFSILLPNTPQCFLSLEKRSEKTLNQLPPIQSQSCLNFFFYTFEVFATL